MLELLGAVLILIIASAICSGTEAAFFSLPVTKARQMAEKSKNGKIVCNIREKPGRPISTIVIFNNLANIVGTYFVAYLASSRLEPSMQAWFPFLLTGSVIILSEIIPKTIGERFSTTIASATARPLALITWILTPVVWMIELTTWVFTRGSRPGVTSENEIKALARIGHQEGIIDEDESHMIGKVFELDDVTAETIMTPRTEMTWIRGIEPIGIATEKVSQSQHSRIVVVGETRDEIKGIFLKSTLLQLMVDGYKENDVVEDFTEPVKLVKGDTPADELLAYFKSSRIHLAVVCDEYGGVAGVVTLEDVLEVLTGEIMDETDTCCDMREVARKNGVIRFKEQGHDQPVHEADESGVREAPSSTTQKIS